MSADTAETNAAESNVLNTRHGELLIGELPSEFLRISHTPGMQGQVERDQQLAQEIAAQEAHQQKLLQQVVVSDRLIISIIEAKLNKNYGVVRMDPYCRVRINHGVYETDTSYNGAKNPRWTKVISVPYTESIQTLHLEVFDERSLSSDSRIAWTNINLPDQVKTGDPVDDWWPLSGKLGEELEGTIHMVISKARVQHRAPGMPVIFPQAGYAMQQPAAPMYGNPYSMPGVPVQHNQYLQQGTSTPPIQPNANVPMFTDSDVKQIKELFPDMDEEAIKAVLEASRGNKDAAINSLLSMQ